MVGQKKDDAPKLERFKQALIPLIKRSWGIIFSPTFQDFILYE